MTHAPSLADRTVADLLAKWPQVARVFVQHRMACVGCAIARFESVAEVAAIYHVPVERFTTELQRVIAASGNRRSRQSRRGGRRGGRR